MPDSFRTRLASTPRSKHASMMRSEIALCPHPAHSVVLPPRYWDTSRPMRFSFFPGADPAGVVISGPATNGRTEVRPYLALGTSNLALGTSNLALLFSAHAGGVRRSVQLCGRVRNGQAFLSQNRVRHAP